jgi:tetratricopeptide (TPR) repeat protein
MDDETMEKLALLRALQRSQDDDRDEELYVSSIHDANDLLEQHMDPGDAKYRKTLVEYITDPRNRVFSECDRYHNFVMDLFRVGDFDLGLQVCDFALERAPYNRDMLGDAIRACGGSSQFERGEAYLRRAYEIPMNKWSFRLFLYSIDFLKSKLDAYPMDEELYTQALALADQYIAYYPFDEHGYNQKAELLDMMNQREQAIVELRHFIFDVQPDAKDSRSELITAQCCVTLLDILDDSNNYDFIIQICEKGLRNTTQAQPSANIGYFVYRKALALDAKAHSENFKIPETISDALKFYQSAYDLNQDRQYARTIEQRYAVLRPFSKDFQPLIKRKLYSVAEG